METRLLIAGEQVAGEGPGLDVENLYAQSPLATVALPSAEQVDAAVGAARAAAAFAVHTETKITGKSWWYPHGTTA